MVEGANVAGRVVEGELPLIEFWRMADRGTRGLGLAVVEPKHVRRAIERHLGGQTSFAQLSAWAGTVASFSCFVIRQRGVRAAVSRLAATELSEQGLRSIAGRLAEAEVAAPRMN